MKIDYDDFVPKSELIQITKNDTVFNLIWSPKIILSIKNKNGSKKANFNNKIFKLQQNKNSNENLESVKII